MRPLELNQEVRKRAVFDQQMPAIRRHLRDRGRWFVGVKPYLPRVESGTLQRESIGFYSFPIARAILVSVDETWYRVNNHCRRLTASQLRLPTGVTLLLRNENLTSLVEHEHAFDPKSPVWMNRLTFLTAGWGRRAQEVILQLPAGLRT